MKRRIFWVMLVLAACYSKEEPKKDVALDISGPIDAIDFVATHAYWGKAYIVFIDREIDCADMSWVQRFNLSGETPPTSTELHALQITYNNEQEQIYEGIYSLGGEAPIKAEMLEINANTFSVSRAVEGILELDEKVDKKSLTGSLRFAFNDGSIIGSFDNVEWCSSIQP